MAEMRIWLFALLFATACTFAVVQVSEGACFKAGGGDCEPSKPRWAGEGYTHRFYPGPYVDRCFLLVNVDSAPPDQSYEVIFEVPCA